MQDKEATSSRVCVVSEQYTVEKQAQTHSIEPISGAIYLPPISISLTNMDSFTTKNLAGRSRAYVFLTNLFPYTHVALLLLQAALNRMSVFHQLLHSNSCQTSFHTLWCFTLSQRGLMTLRASRRDIYLSRPAHWCKGRAALPSDSRQPYEIQDLTSLPKLTHCKRSFQCLAGTTRSSIMTSRGLFCAGYPQIL